MKYRFFSHFLISQTLVAINEVNDATIGEAVLLDVMLHDKVVLVGIDADVCIMGEAEVHDVAEDAVNIRVAGNAMYDMIGFYVIQPFAIVYLRVSRLRGGQKSEIADNLLWRLVLTIALFNDKTSMLLHIVQENSLRRVAVSPLVHVARRPHNLLRGLHHLHNLRYVCWFRLSDYSTHQKISPQKYEK